MVRALGALDTPLMGELSTCGAHLRRRYEGSVVGLGEWVAGRACGSLREIVCSSPYGRGVLILERGMLGEGVYFGKAWF